MAQQCAWTQGCNNPATKTREHAFTTANGNPAIAEIPICDECLDMYATLEAAMSDPATVRKVYEFLKTLK